MLRQVVRVSLLAFLLLMLTALPSEGRGGHGGHDGHHGGHHHGHHHGHRFHGGTAFFVGVGPWWWGPPSPWWYYDPYWYYGPYSYGPPRVVVEQPQIYIQQAAPSTPPGYWYYCASAQRYYPDVATCPDAWIRVPPQPN